MLGTSVESNVAVDDLLPQPHPNKSRQILCSKRRLTATVTESSLEIYAEKRIFEKPYTFEHSEMTDKIRVLFVCTANAARSQLAEALLRHTDSEHFEAFSAGTQPGVIDPRTYAALDHLAVDTSGLRSKSIEEFAGERFDYVITLCDKAAQECQTPPGAGEALEWNFEDPVTSNHHDAFRHTLHEIHERIKMFVLVKTKH